MRIIFILSLFIGLRIEAQYLLPQPKSIVLEQGEFKLSANTKFRVESPSENLKNYTKRFIQRLAFKSETIFINAELQDTASNSEIVVKTHHTTDTISSNTDESYELKINKQKIELIAPNNIGAYRGLETLLQLVKKGDKEDSFIVCQKIKDEPRFPWRGLLIDVCRHWVPLHILKRNIDAMAAVKMNVLHLHLSEDQGFRIESKKFPKLHQQGSNGKFYTQEEIKSLVNYGTARGVRIIPELDIPGHVTSWLVGHPELAAVDREYKIEKGFGVFNPSLNPAEENTYDFLDTLLTEMSQLFPDEYFHIGGDENNGKDWDSNKKIQRFKIKNELNSNAELQAYFNQRIAKILARNGKTMIGWDEILDPKLQKPVGIQSWRGKESIAVAVQQGFQSILSNGYYLDKVHSMEHYYMNDPIPSNSSLTFEEKSLILGGEATIWSELADQSNIESRIWPATLAVAERLWSSSSNCKLDDFYKKAPFVSKSLQEFGLKHVTFQQSKLSLLMNPADHTSSLPFIQALEPLKGYKRHLLLKGTPKYSTTAPLNRLADALFTESFSARDFNQLVIGNCNNEGKCKSKEKIKLTLVKWIKSTENFIEISSKSKTLKETRKLAFLVQELCELAWRKVNSPSEISESEIENDRALKLIDEIESLKLEVHFAPLRGIKKIFPKD